MLEPRGDLLRAEHDGLDLREVAAVLARPAQAVVEEARRADQRRRAHALGQAQAAVGPHHLAAARRQHHAARAEAAEGQRPEREVRREREHVDDALLRRGDAHQVEPQNPKTPL